MMNKTQEYYENAQLWLPEYSNWRIFKFRVDNGTKHGKIIKINDTIKDTETLRKHILRHLPVDCYYSCNCFLNPTQVKGNQTKNRILFKQTPFDFDADKPYSQKQLEVVRQSAIKLIEFIRRKYRRYPKDIVFTGGKGFQILYDYIENLNIDEMNFYGLDKEVSTDDYRVIRLPQTLNKLGRMAVRLTESELAQGMDYILKKSIDILHDYGERAARLEEPMTISPRSELGHSSRTAPMDYAHAIYVTNEVNGTRRFVPILKYRWKEGINPRKDMKKLALKYGLNEWYLIKTLEELYCISLVAFDKRRLEKIFNSTKSLSKSEFKKFGRVFIRVSSINNEEDIPHSAGVLFFSVPFNKDFHYSKPHLDLIKHFDFLVNPFIKRYIGRDKPKIFLTTKTRGGV